MSRPLKLKVTGTVLCRFSNSPIMGYRVVCGGAPQTFSHPSEESVHALFFNWAIFTLARAQ
jgi:hypothetical protein